MKVMFVLILFFKYGYASGVVNVGHYEKQSQCMAQATNVTRADDRIISAHCIPVNVP